MFAGYRFAELLQFAQQIYGPDKRLQLGYYAYVVPLGTNAALQLLTAQLQITGNADFICSAVSYTNGNDSISVPKTILIQDSATGERWMNSAVNLAAFCDCPGFVVGSNAPAMNSLPYPRFMPGRSAYLVQVQFDGNIYASNTVVFQGVQVRALN